MSKPLSISWINRSGLAFLLGFMRCGAWRAGVGASLFWGLMPGIMPVSIQAATAAIAQPGAAPISTQVSTDQISADQIATVQTGTVKVTKAQVATAQLDTAQTGTAQVATAQEATQIATAQAGITPTTVNLAQGDEDINIRVYEQASPGVVAIDTGSGTGSGSIITPDGLVLTNAHVVERTEGSVTVKLADGRELVADVVGFDPDGRDLAALQIRNATNLPIVHLARPNSVRVGQRAFAIGSPFGLSNTFTIGIVSRINPDDGMIQTDAAINPGNSGGPLLNSNAEMVGVNTAIYTTGENSGNIGIGFAVPIEQVNTFIAAVNSGQASATARRTGLPEVDPTPIQANSAPFNAQLTEGDYVLPSDGSLFDAYSFSGEAGQPITITMDSSEFDPYLILLDSVGNRVAFDDDSGGNYNARIDAVLPDRGDYLVLANTYQGGQSGAYRLRLSSGSGQTSVPSARGQSLILRAQGELTSSDQILESDQSFFDEHLFTGQAGQQLEILLTSSEFDTYLILVNPSGEALDQNDDRSPGDTNSLLQLTLPESGSYRVIVNSYDASGRGAYELQVRELN